YQQTLFAVTYRVAARKLSTNKLMVNRQRMVQWYNKHLMKRWQSGNKTERSICTDTFATQFVWEQELGQGTLSKM
ncbi:hypothetical protein J6590_090515, partial [Homalodisca vitripennis]